MKHLLSFALAASLLPAAGQAQSLDPRIQKLTAAVSEDRLQQLLQKLSSFKTRNTCSDPAAPDGIGAARQWIFDELKRTSSKLQVSFDTHRVENIRGCQGAIEVRNVMAVLPGKSARRIYVSGHYDSLNLGGGGQQTSNAGAGRGAAGGPGASGTPAAPGQPARPARDPNVVAPGANDDGSGTVLSMELARVFAESGLDFDEIGRASCRERV